MSPSARPSDRPRGAGVRASRRAAVAACVVVLASPAAGAAQQLLDRVLARVGEDPITLTDVRAARELGILDLQNDADDRAALERMIDRRLVLAELARFPQPEPNPGDVDAELAGMAAAAGGRLERIEADNGLDDGRLRELARDTLRMRAYLENRFPLVSVSNADAQQYYQDHPDEFRSNGQVLPYAEAEPQARAAAAAQARSTRVARWLEGLRGRFDVVVVR